MDSPRNANDLNGNRPQQGISHNEERPRTSQQGEGQRGASQQRPMTPEQADRIASAKERAAARAAAAREHAAASQKAVARQRARANAYQQERRAASQSQRASNSQAQRSAAGAQRSAASRAQQAAAQNSRKAAGVRSAAAAREDISAYSASNYRGGGSKNSCGKRTLRGIGGFGGEHRNKIIIGIVAAFVVLILIPGIAFAVSVNGAKTDAGMLMTEGKTLVQQMKEGDSAGAKDTALELSDTVKKLNDNVSSPLWAGATLLPFVGGDIADVRTLASVANELSGELLFPIVDALPEDGFSSLFSNGNVNLPVIEALLKPIDNSQKTIGQCAQRVEDMGEPNLEQLKEPVSSLKDLFGMLDVVSQHSQALLDMLGAQGQRAYLIIACNNSEIRPTGGMPGQLGLMKVTDGHIEVGDFVGHTMNPTLKGPDVIPLPEDEVALFGQRVGAEMRDVNFIPDFARVGAIEKAIWEQNGNTPVEGVIALDPVFLGHLLGLTGGFVASNGVEINGDTAAEYLLNGVYVQYPTDTEMQDALFTEIASKSLEQVFAKIGKVDFTKLIETISTCAEDRRLYIWMDNQKEEAAIEAMGLAGLLSTDEAQPELGIYLGSATACKMFWYLDVDVNMSEGTRNFDGTTTYDVDMTITNTLSDGAAWSLPSYITGSDPIARSPSDMLLDIYLFVPLGGSIDDLQVDGFFTGPDYWNGLWNTCPGENPLTLTTYNGHYVWYGMTQIMGDTTTKISFKVTTSSKAEEPLKLDVTPLANENI